MLCKTSESMLFFTLQEDNMRIVSRNFIKTTLLALLPCLSFTFSSCSNLATTTKSTVTFTLNTARAALSNKEQLYIDVQLNGGYKSEQTSSITDQSKLSFTFNNIPIGKSVYVSAQVYFMYKDVKTVIYSGISEKQDIEEGDNRFTLKLESLYDCLSEAQYSSLIARPLFYSGADNQKLSNNKLPFSSMDDNYYWQYEKLNQYQKVIIKYRNASENASSGHIKFKLLNSQTKQTMGLDEKPVPSDTVSYEFFLPDDVVYDTICIQNEPGVSEVNFICIIESIELQTIGSFELDHINMPSNNDISVIVNLNGTEKSNDPDDPAYYGNPISLRSDKYLKLTAEEGFTSYTWKLNGEVKCTTREFSIGPGTTYNVSTSSLNNVDIYEITLLADSATEHKSWTVQLTIQNI